jgi:ATP-dependent DNA helicase DinG
MTNLLPPILSQSLENIAKSLPGFVSRPTQHQMMAAVFNTLSRTRHMLSAEEGDLPNQGESILIVEGPTGTGKSLAYLLPAIIAANLYKKHLVVSSATVMLQEQLANKDIPFVAQHAGIPVTYAIAKGRGRYACPQKLYQLLMQNAQTDLIGDNDNISLAAEKKLHAYELSKLQQLAHQLGEKNWTGDRDSLNEEVSDPLWSRITNDRHGCLKRECAYFKGCPFYEARDRLETVDVIVVNHDLLLADLAMGGGVILPSPKDTFYCIDEAHHLSAKAVEQFSAAHTLHGTIAWLEKLHGAIGKAESLLAEYSITQKAQYAIDVIRENLQTLSHALEGLFAQNFNMAIYRCAHGILPKGFELFCGQLLPAIQSLLTILQNLQDVLKRKKAKQEGKISDALFDRLATDLGFFSGRVENLQAVWQLLVTDAEPNHPPIAKWIVAEKTPGHIEYTLCASPVRASHLLAKRLWKQSAGAVLTSATLRSLGSFEKLLAETGLNHYPETTCITLPSPFNLKQQGQLRIPPMKADPTNPVAHTQELIKLMPNLIALDKHEGTLVLFSSKKQMLEVAESLPPRWQKTLLIQGSQPKEQLIKTHFSRVAENKASVLFGLASFAEGLDLPGKACTHLIIAKLPFSMPDDPVSQTLAEWISLRGGNPFAEMTLPEASIRLIQAVGRLIRSETDYGVVTILDTRLTSKAYGRLLKQNLPPFGSLN